MCIKSFILCFALNTYLVDPKRTFNKKTDVFLINAIFCSNVPLLGDNVIVLASPGHVALTGGDLPPVEVCPQKCSQHCTRLPLSLHR